MAKAQYVEAGLGVVLVVAAVGFIRDALVATSFPGGAVFVTALVLALGQTAPLVLRRVNPLAAWAVLAVTCVACWGMERVLGVAAGRTTGVAQVVGLAVLYRVGRTLPRRAAAVVAVVTAAAVAVARPEPGWLMMVLLVGASVVLGVLVSAWRTAESGLTRQREERAALTERARIARELHDIVAHHMSVVALQAESAPHRLGGLPAPAVREFASIADGARSALDEMRQLLRALRSEEPAERGPQPDLSDVDQLVESVRRAGVAARLELAGARTEVPALCATTAYRIVQEGLANAVKHAPGAAVTVRLTRTARTLEVEVRNGPPTGMSNARPGAGHGLRGVRERVELLSGTLSAGSTPDGGFLLRAELPVGKEHR